MKIRIKYKSFLFAFSEKQYVKHALIIFIRSLLYFSCCISLNIIYVIGYIDRKVTIMLFIIEN